MRRYTPKEIVRILRSARTDPNNSELQEFVEHLRKEWRRFAQKKWPWLAEYHEDAINAALARICERIDQLEEESRVDEWVTHQFVLEIDGYRKKAKRERDRTGYLKGREDGGDAFDLLPSNSLTPEEKAILRERLEIVQSIIQLSRAAWLRMVEGWSVKKVAEETGKTEDYIRTLTHRMRKALKQYLEEPWREEEIFRESKLPRELIELILEILKGLKK